MIMLLKIPQMLSGSLSVELGETLEASIFITSSYHRRRLLSSELVLKFRSLPKWVDCNFVIIYSQAGEVTEYTAPPTEEANWVSC